jgi:hypothetical protein
MRRPAALLGVLALACIAASSASAKLTPTEEKWAKPVISVWNEQNTALHLVIQAASATNALQAGSANNKKLTIVLNTFVVCTPLLKKAGAPPSPRLKAFLAALSTACSHDTTGANDFARAVGAYGKNNQTAVGADLKAGVAAFKVGTTYLNKAYKALTAVGGANIFKA